MADVEGKKLGGPLEGCDGVVGGAKGGGGVGVAPGGVGAGDKSCGVGEGGAEGVNGGRVGEGKECFRWECRGDGTGYEAGAKRKGRARGPRPPRWSTVNGIKQMWCSLMAWIVASALCACDGRPVNFKRMPARCVRNISGMHGSDRLARLLATGGW
jgi:hypothetical protein